MSSVVFIITLLIIFLQNYYICSDVGDKVGILSTFIKTLYKSEDIVNKIIQEFSYWAKENTNVTIINNDLFNNVDCFSRFSNLNEKGRNLFKKIINNSGKAQGDAGLEDDCIADGLTYLFFEFKNKMNTSLVENSRYVNLMKFLESEKYFIGFCTWRECNNLYKNFFDIKLNKPFFNYLESIGFCETKLFTLRSDEYNNNKETEILKSHKMKIFIIFLWIILFYLIFRCTITVIGYVFYENECDVNEFKHELSYDETINSHSFENSNEEEKTKYLLLASKPKNELRKGCFYSMYKIFSIRKCGRILFKIKSKYYDETNLKVLSGLKLFLLFMLVYDQNIYCMSKLPHRDFGGFPFFSSFWFFLIKIGSYSIDCLIALDGIYLGFKFLSYVKKKNQNPSLKDFFIFYLSFLPKLFILFFSFFLFHLFILEIGSLLGSLSTFNFYIENYVNYKQCVHNPEIILIPFYLQYFHPNNTNTYPLCYRYINYLSCEFICFTFTIILFYILMKLKSKRIDACVLLLNCLNFILLYFCYNKDILGEYYTFPKVFGEIYTVIRPHIFYTNYFFGINVGIMLFYYIDITSGCASKENIYNLFFYNFRLMKYLGQKSNKFKSILVGICILANLLIAFNFNFLLMYSETKDNNLLIKNDLFIFLLFIYQGKIYAFIFLIFVSAILLSTKEGNLYKFLASKLFTPVSRFSIAFFCLHDSIVCLFYSIYNIQIYLNYQNLFFITLGLFFITLVFSIFIVILFEMPIRMVYKIFTRTDKIRIRLKADKIFN